MTEGSPLIRMTGWRPVIGGVECGCEILSSDGQASYATWSRCGLHLEISFADFKKIVIDENISSLIASGDIGVSGANALRVTLYEAHGIVDGV